jgi:hypothetical protein
MSLLQQYVSVSKSNECSKLIIPVDLISIVLVGLSFTIDKRDLVR